MTTASIPSAAALVAAARGVVFDKDGTLIDLDARWLPFFESYIARIADLSGDDAVAPALRTLLGVEPERLVPESPAAVDTGARIGELVLAELVSRGVPRGSASRIVADAGSTAGFGPLTPRGDVAGAFTALLNGGRRLGVATSDDRRNTIAELGTIGVLDVVEILRCGDDDGPVKPDPEVLLLMAEAWGLTPGELLYVGDSRHDLATARAAGVPFVMVGRPAVRTATTCHDGREGLDVGDAQVDTVDELIP